MPCGRDAVKKYPAPLRQNAERPEIPQGISRLNYATANHVTAKSNVLPEKENTQSLREKSGGVVLHAPHNLADGRTHCNTMTYGRKISVSVKALCGFKLILCCAAQGANILFRHIFPRGSRSHIRFRITFFRVIFIPTQTTDVLLHDHSPVFCLTVAPLFQRLFFSGFRLPVSVQVAIFTGRHRDGLNTEFRLRGISGVEEAQV